MAGPKHAEAAAFAAEQAHANEGSSGWHGQEMGGQEDVSITKTQEWMDPLLSNVVENALAIIRFASTADVPWLQGTQLNCCSIELNCPLIHSKQSVAPSLNW